MGKAFFSKKQKAQMKERRKKKKIALAKKNPGNDDSADKDATQQQAGDSSFPVQDLSTIDNSKKRAREEHEGEEADATPTAPVASVSTKKDPLTIRTRMFDRTLQVAVPSDLSSQEAKKFRKDARRQLRKQKIKKGGNSELNDEMEIEFVDEEEFPPEKKQKKKETKSYPSIKELREQKRQLDQLQKEENKRQEKIHQIPDGVKSKYLALDCEMVGIGSDGKKSALARVSIVDWMLNVVLDTYVQVPIRVTDFRTHVSGIEPKHIRAQNNPNAMEVNECRTKVGEILKDKILVGHALSNDLKALMLLHPKAHIRDTSKFRPFQRYGNNKWRARKLRDLVKENLAGKYDGFQEEEHDSVHDAKATMELFQLVRNQWEKELANKTK